MNNTRNFPDTWRAMMADQPAATKHTTAPGQLSPRVSIHCSYCGSDDMTRDACARWDEDAQEWSLATVYDDVTCGACGKETHNFVEMPLADQTPPAAPVDVAALTADRDRLLAALRGMMESCPACGGSGRERETIEDDTPCTICGTVRAAIAGR